MTTSPHPVSRLSSYDEIHHDRGSIAFGAYILMLHDTISAAYLGIAIHDFFWAQPVPNRNNMLIASIATIARTSPHFLRY
jgi:hypothetical protein